MHVKTQHKMFCSCSANIYGKSPNTHTCPTCLGLPGALPIPNEQAVVKTQTLGLALGCELNKNTRFDRKHYFYHDLPKGYQISQYKKPFCIGQDNVIERIHLEEDTAKSFHEEANTLIDFNKSGMPLIELVTKPVFTSANEAVDFARDLRDLVRYLNISDADMEKGQLRVEPNISVRTLQMEKSGELPDYKVEVKNINSFKYMEKAVEYEFSRQVKMLELGQTPLQENRGWDEKRNVTVAQRLKEESHDYRYFPEPDIPPFEFSEEYIQDLIRNMPVLPSVKVQEYVEKYDLTPDMAQNIVHDTTNLQDKFDELISNTNISPLTIAKLLLNNKDLRTLNPQQFQKVFDDSQDNIVDEEQLKSLVNEVLEQNPNEVEKYLSGKDSLIKFFIGQVMKQTKGKADPQITEEIIKKQLKTTNS